MLLNRFIAAFIILLFCKTPSFSYEESWYGIYLKNKLIGWSEMVMDADSGYVNVENKVNIRIMAMNVPINIYTESYTVLSSKDGMPEKYSYKLNGGIQNTVITGYRDKKEFILKVDNGYGPQSKNYKLDDSFTLPATADYLLRNEKLSMGWSKELEVFSPELLQKVKIVMTVTGERTIKYNNNDEECFIVETSVNNISNLSFIGKKDNICYRVDQVPGIIFILMNKDKLLKEFKEDKNINIDIIRELTIPVEGKIDFKNPVKYLNAEIDGLSKNQHIDGLFQEVTYKRNKVFLSINKMVEPADKLEKEKYKNLRDIFQGDTGYIISLSKNITKNCKDADSKIRNIYEWIQDNISKKVTFSIPDPEQVLNTRQGDCNEISILFTALCRASGIPARSVMGLVGLRDGFYYHAWNEILFDDGWHSVDAALVQFQSDALHIRLYGDESNDILEMAAAVKNYKIKIIDYK